MLFLQDEGKLEWWRLPGRMRRSFSQGQHLIWTLEEDEECYKWSREWPRHASRKGLEMESLELINRKGKGWWRKKRSGRQENSRLQRALDAKRRGGFGSNYFQYFKIFSCQCSEKASLEENACKVLFPFLWKKSPHPCKSLMAHLKRRLQL